MTRRLEYYVERVQGDIECCPNDERYNSGDVSCAKIEDILIDRNVPENLWDEVVDQLRCPKCDSEIELWQPVGVKAQHAIVHEQRVEKALTRYSDKLFEFANVLRNSPYLGALHPTGKRIVQEIAKLGGSAITDQSWFRGDC